MQPASSIGYTLGTGPRMSFSDSAMARAGLSRTVTFSEQVEERALSAASSNNLSLKYGRRPF